MEIIMIFQIIKFDKNYPMDFEIVYDTEFVSFLKEMLLIFLIARLLTGKFKFSLAIVLSFVYYKIYIG